MRVVTVTNLVTGAACMKRNKSKVFLISDFVDYYDHWFDNPYNAQPYYRVSMGGPTRPEMFAIAKAAGLYCPDFGTVAELKMRHSPEKPIVLYTDPTAHRGEGKELTTLRSAPSNLYASLYVAEPNGVAWRYLQIGKRVFWLQYKSADWRSNVDPEITFIEAPEQIPCFDAQLLAIDFIPSDQLYFVDYNVAPGLRGTPIQGMLSAKEVVELIRCAI